MKKKGFIVFETLMKGIIVLIVLGFGIKLIGSLSSNPIQYLLGFGDIKKFDEGISERFEADSLENKDARASVNALLYAINKLAVYNQYEEGSLTKRAPNPATDSKEFEGVKVEPTTFDQRVLKLKGKNTEEIAEQVAENILSCWRILEDKAFENTQCFAIDASEIPERDSRGNKITIKQSDVIGAFLKLREDDRRCDDPCKKRIGDMSGDWNFYNPISYFNYRNFKWDPELEFGRDYIKDPNEVRVKTGKKPVISICGDNQGVNQVHITTSAGLLGGKCKIPFIGQSFGFSIVGFSLPQRVSFSSNWGVDFVEGWMSAYGDPDYLIYYEKFPKGEEAYWHPSSYRIAVGTILAIEGGAIAADFLLPVLGRYVYRPLKVIISGGVSLVWDYVVKPILQSAFTKGKTFVGSLLKKFPSLANGVTQRVKGFISNIAPNTFNSIATGMKSAYHAIYRRALANNLVEDYLQVAADGTVRDVLKRRLGKLFVKLDAKAIEAITDKYRVAIMAARDRIEGEGLQFTDDVTKKVSPRAKAIFEEEIDRALGNIKKSDLSLSHFQEVDVEASVKSVIQDIDTGRGASAGLFDELAEIEQLFGPGGKFVNDPKGLQEWLKNEQFIKEVGETNRKFLEAGARRAAELENKVIRQRKVAAEQDNLIFDALGDKGLRDVKSSLKEALKRDAEEGTLRFAGRFAAYRFRTNSVRRAIERLRQLATGDLSVEERKQILDEIVQGNEKALQNMQEADILRFFIHKQGNRHVVDDIFREGDYAWKQYGYASAGEFRQEAAESLTKHIDELIKDYPFSERAKNALLVQQRLDKELAFLNPVKKKRHLVAVIAAIEATRLESNIAKFTSVGTNALGLKWGIAPPEELGEKNIAPYLPRDYNTMDENAKLNWLEQNFFPNIGQDKRFTGLLPEVGTFYLALTKDRFVLWADQFPDRFHLVSPCYAAVYITVSRCTCFGKPTKDMAVSWFEDEEIFKSGEHNDRIGKKVDFTYKGLDQKRSDSDKRVYLLEGEAQEDIVNQPGKDWRRPFNQMLYTLDEKNEPVKYCPDSGYFTVDQEYHPKCIKINPILDETKDQNYCYHGKSVPLSVASILLNFALPISASLGGGALCALPPGNPLVPFSPYCAIIGGAIGGTIGSFTYAYLSVGHQWPQHS